MKEQVPVFEGDVIEALPNTQFKIMCEGKEYRCYASGKMKKNKIYIIVGDRVRFEWPANTAVGRIIRRK